jgi:hypothetical protein
MGFFVTRRRAGKFTVYKRGGSAASFVELSHKIICFKDLRPATMQPNLPRRSDELTNTVLRRSETRALLLQGAVPFSD